MQTGPNNLTEETYGVNYRALNDLFCLTEERKATFSYEVSVQMMEIYNEQVRDLLATDGSNKRYPFSLSSFSLFLPNEDFICSMSFYSTYVCFLNA